MTTKPRHTKKARTWGFFATPKWCTAFLSVSISLGQPFCASAFAQTTGSRTATASTTVEKSAQDCPSFSLFLATDAGSSSNDNNQKDEKGPLSSLEDELTDLQTQLSLIEALEERNKAQLESFVDEEDQWDSLEEEEKEFLLQKDFIIQRIEELSSDLN